MSVTERVAGTGTVCLSLMLGAACMVFCGCKRLQSTVPMGELHPLSAQLIAGGPTGQMYRNAQDGMSFPIPANFIQLQRNDPAESNTVHLGTRTKACQIALVEQPRFTDIVSHQAGVRDKLTRDGHPSTIVGPEKLGTTEGSHMHVSYSQNVQEDFYTVRHGGSVLSMIIVYSTACRPDFGPTVQGFRFD